MVVIPRTGAQSDPAVGGQIGSPRVATRTVVGMVLGVLCLFTIVLSYQLISRPSRGRSSPAARRPNNASHPSRSLLHTPFDALSHLWRRSGKKLRRTRATQNSPQEEKDSPLTPDHPQRSAIGRVYHVCTRPLRMLFSRRTESGLACARDGTRAPNLRERRALRSLYLNTKPPSQRYPSSPSRESHTSPTRKRMAGLFHLNLRTPSHDHPTLSPLSSPSHKGGRSHRLYQRLDDSLYSDWSNEQTHRTDRPLPAFLSPWSPSEYEFPYPTLHSPTGTSSSEPGTPPPLYPPPPAYVPEVPLRSPGSAPPSPARPAPVVAKAASTSSWSPASPIILMLEEEISQDIGEWTEPSQVNASFVISNDSDSDAEDVMSDADSAILGSVESVPVEHDMASST
ncbi:hypothetical protein PYCCODRAFT_1461571 [Trametes coccinea BRFM310]|uniref:Uncharacterized protein n=1 Tax=Trametes coccinea (strain BRFM310) TaxID=1353009 RepID=A0A1Y2IC62_TRAC3|nr:hypothetical protein PYCCODRAFT_1461571 [Trametes coccinea BRFM310]